MSTAAAKQQSGFAPILAIMNPRQIPECMHSLEALDVRKAWLQNYTEWQLQEVIASIVRDESIHFTHLCLVADDCIVTQPALDAVLAHAPDHPVVTGYCRLDWSHPLVNLTRRSVHGDGPSAGAYDFYSLDEVQAWPDQLVPTGFVGFALTCMSREMWREFPFRVFGTESRSYASDFNLSMRLRDAQVPMLAVRDGLVGHFKKQWNTLDSTPGRELRIGIDPAAVELEA